jgi:hypothetical protein
MISVTKLAEKIHIGKEKHDVILKRRYQLYMIDVYKYITEL